MSESLEIVLWGDTQVGKTTALAAYLCEHQPAWLDRSAKETEETLARLSGTWNVLRENRLPPGTAGAEYYDVRHRDQRLIRFRDMRGGHAGSLATEDRQALRRAAGLLVFTGWPGERDVTNLIAVDNALRLMDGRCCPLALVVTKVESFLKLEQLGLFLLENPVAVAERLRLPATFRQLMEKFPPHSVFLISVYGYTPEGYPAHYRDEFGRLVPWKIQPKNVHSPFDHVIASLV